MSSVLSARSYLFVPGNKPALFDKAAASGADVVILDLEDAVGGAAKDEARANIAAWLEHGSRVAIRINAVRTREMEADLALCRHRNVVAVVVPKVETGGDVRTVRAKLPMATAILPMIESANSLHLSFAIASEHGVQRLVFGSLDFQADLGIPDDNGLTAFRSELVFTSRRAGIAPPVDGVTRKFDTSDAVQADTARARSLGFGGKLCIHPRQVEWVNAGFSPTPDEIAWAQRVIAADSAAGGGVAKVDDGMIDRPVMLRARGILANATRK